MNCFVRWADRFTGATGIIGAWVVAPLILFTCYEVVSRYVLDSPTVWAFELGYMLTGANFLLGMGYALRENAHIRIEVFYQHYSPRTQAVIDTLTYVLIVIPMCSWLAWGLFEYALGAYLSSEHSGFSAWNPLVWPFRCAFFIGFASLALQGLAKLSLCAAMFREPQGLSPDPALAPRTHQAESV